MPNRDNKYYYQHFERRKSNVSEKAKAHDRQVFLNSLGLPDELRADLERDHDQLLDNFAAHIMGNIHWYEKKIDLSVK